jgi:hypothetical protein
MALKHFNWKTLIAMGLVAGLIQVATGVAMYVAGVYFAPWSMFVSGFVLILCIVFGIRWYRDSVLRGRITYGQALMVGIVISVSTGILYAVYNIISISFVYPRFLEQMSSLNPAMRDSLTANTIALSNMIRLSVGGTVVSALVSLILKRERRADVAASPT